MYEGQRSESESEDSDERVATTNPLLLSCFVENAPNLASLRFARRRFYPLFGQVSSLAPVLAGVYVTQFASKAADFQGSMHRLTIAICGAGGMICFLYCKADNYNDCGTPRLAKFKTKPKPNTKPNMISSIKFLASSEYLRLLSFMVIGYGLSINFTEIIWKSLVKKKVCVCVCCAIERLASIPGRHDDLFANTATRRHGDTATRRSTPRLSITSVSWGPSRRSWV